MSDRKHWSVLRWCQVAGLLIPGLGTAGIFAYFFWILPHQQGVADFPNVPGLLLIHTIFPTIMIFTSHLINSACTLIIGV